MIKVGDKIKYIVKDDWINIPIGTVLTVTNVRGDIVTSAVDLENSKVECFMSYNEIRKHFVKVDENNNDNLPKRKWTDWKTISPYDYVGQSRYCEVWLREWLKNQTTIRVETRNNSKKTEVRFVVEDNKGEFVYSKGVAYCNKVDEYDEVTGISIALFRAFKKMFCFWTDDLIDSISR